MIGMKPMKKRDVATASGGGLTTKNSYLDLLSSAAALKEQGGEKAVAIRGVSPSLDGNTAMAVSHVLARAASFSIEGYDIDSNTDEVSPLAPPKIIKQHNSSSPRPPLPPTVSWCSNSSATPSQPSSLTTLAPRPESLDSIQATVAANSMFFPVTSINDNKLPSSSDLPSLLSNSTSTATLSSTDGSAASATTIVGCETNNSCTKCMGCGLLAAQALVLQNLQRENAQLKKQMVGKDATIASLTQKSNDLERHISELRQLPTGKISQIPIEDMLDIMREYGSEVSENAVVPRKETVQKASVVRQFRRWNPNFLRHFAYRDGKWAPRLGKKLELERRALARKEKQQQAGSSNSNKK